MKLSQSFTSLLGPIGIAITGAAGLVAAADTTVSFDGRNFVNHGLVGFGRINASAVDSYGETLGGLGSSIALESIKSKGSSYTGQIRLNPDRGHNTQTTTDYRARSQTFTFTFDPTKGNSTVENIALKYDSSQLYRYAAAGLNYTTGLDPTAVKSATFATPPLPIAPSDNHVAFDTEGFAFSADGHFEFVSDEYGPYIHIVERQTGIVLTSVRPPDAIVPKDAAGNDNFTAVVNPTTGRTANQGFEGLTLDRKTNTLWALLQSATIQDGGADKTTNRYSRLLAYDVSKVPIGPAKLIHEYVVPLPQSKKLKTRASSELHIVDSTTFLVLARDGNGFGDTDSGSSYKHADLISTKNATDIHGTKYDAPANAVSPGGVLDAAITPTPYASFVDFVDPTQLAKFGLQTGGAFDRTLIASKLESLALAPSSTPDNFLLFVVSDNDFITKNGHQAAQDQTTGKYVLQDYSDPYAEQYGDADTQVFIYNVTLPGYTQGSSSFPN